VSRSKLDKPKPIDYAVMFGGPLIFLLIAFVGIRSFVGPPPPVPVVQRLRDGAVKPGMTEGEVLAAVGPPKGRLEKGDGGFAYRYQRSAWDSQRSTFLEEDAYIDFSAGGTVTGITFDSRVPPR
jgi:hypothetical protein